MKLQFVLNPGDSPADAKCKGPFGFYLVQFRRRYQPSHAALLTS